jgi:hypothetical protein
VIFRATWILLLVMGEAEQLSRKCSSLVGNGGVVVGLRGGRLSLPKVVRILELVVRKGNR